MPDDEQCIAGVSWAETPVMDRRISFIPSLRGAVGDSVSIATALGMIRNGLVKRQISELRRLIATADRGSYTEAKKLLPAVTFGGTYRGSRTAANVSSYSGVIVLDVDHLNAAQMESAWHAFTTDNHTVACWRSPSGEGIKALVEIRKESRTVACSISEFHRQAFRSVLERADLALGVILDPSGKDLLRLCFLSHDPDLFINSNSVPLEFQPTNSTSPGGATTAAKSKLASMPTGIPQGKWKLRSREERARDRARMNSIIRYLSNRKVSITASRESWVAVAYSLASTFPYEVGIKYFLRLSRLDGAAHSESESSHLFSIAYAQSRGESSLGTVVHFAKKVGYHSSA